MENLTTVSIVHNIDDDFDYWNTCQEQVDAWFVNEYLNDRDIIGSNPQGVCLTFTHDGINFEMVLTEKHIAWLQSELARGLEKGNT
jgi:hypothetical protein